MILALLAMSLQPGDWTISREPDAMTDRVEVQALLRGEGGRLVFMCSRGQRAELVFQPTGFLGGRLSGYELRDFTYRIDQGPPVNSLWRYHDSYASAPSDDAIRSMLAAISGGGAMLRVRAVGYDNSFHDATFRLEGALAAIQEARSAC